MFTAPICPYCSRRAVLVSGAVLFRGRANQEAYHYWYCEPCRAWVLANHDNLRPRGTLANAETRRLRIEAHDALDPIWQNGLADREHVYQMLAHALNIPRQRCHVKNFQARECRRVKELCKHFATVRR